MRKTKDILIFVFLFVVILAIGFAFYFFYDIQKKYAEPPYKRNYIKTEARFLYGLSIKDSILFRTKFRLTKIETDSTIQYDYVSSTDISKSFKLRYNLNSKILYFDIATEYNADKLNVISDENKNWFNSYNLIEPEIDGVSPILFNTDYGILAFTSPLGPSAFFMSKENDSLFIMRINENLYH